MNRPALWVRLAALLPLRALYGIAAIPGWLAFWVFNYRSHVIRENLQRAFPHLDERGLRVLMKDYYANFSQVMAELLKSSRLMPDEFGERVRIHGLERVRGLLARGQSVLLIAAHQCNWEWMLLALSAGLGYPVDAAYKPIKRAWAEREMLKIRSRFGARLVPAKDLLTDILKRRGCARVVAIVADQEPRDSERKHWTTFLNRDTAFYLGAEEIARVTHMPVFFIAMRRVSRGFYEMEFEPLAAEDEVLRPGELTERYARHVEKQIVAAPADWPWSYRRWKLKKSLYESPPRQKSNP